MSEAATHITIRGLTKSFAGQPLYTNFDLDFPKGRITSVFGPNGCGKSTLGQILAMNFVNVAGRELGGSGAVLCSWEDLASEVKRNVRNFARDRKSTRLNSSH